MRDRGTRNQPDPEYGNSTGKMTQFQQINNTEGKTGWWKEKKPLQIKMYEPCLDPSLNKSTVKNNNTTVKRYF